MSTQALVPIAHGSLIVEMAKRYGLQPDKFLTTIKATVFPSDRQASNEQLAAFLSVAKQYELNPFIKEIYAFPAKGGGIVPIVSIDGWCSLINRQPQMDGLEFEDRVEDGRLVAVTCKIFRKDRSHPMSVTEYMSECQRGTDVWGKYPSRMLRHKALIQCARYAFALSGIYDPDEAERIQESEPPAVIYYDTPEEKKNLIADQMKTNLAKLTGKPQEAPKSLEVPPTPPETEKAKEEAIPPKEQPSEETPQPELVGPNIIQQEVKVVDVERRNRKGKGQFWLLSCEIAGTDGELMIHVWKTDLFDYVSKASGKVCDFGLKRSEKDDSVFYSLEQISRIGDQAFLDNKPATVPTAGQLGFETEHA